VRAIAIALVLAACAAPQPAPTSPSTAPPELHDPAVRTVLVGRASRDLACEPSAVVVRALATPYSSVGIAIVEGNGQRITYAVMPATPIVDDDLVMIAHIPVIASAPPLPADDAGSASAP